MNRTNRAIRTKGERVSSHGTASLLKNRRGEDFMYCGSEVVTKKHFLVILVPDMLIHSPD
jgi:hypothetical protein